MFSEGGQRMHWEQMGKIISMQYNDWYCSCVLIIFQWFRNIYNAIVIFFMQKIICTSMENVKILIKALFGWFDIILHISSFCCREDSCFYNKFTIDGDCY